MDAAARSLRISLCGRVVLTRDGVDKELGGRNPGVLLALLATERHRTVPSDELAEALWGERLPQSWKASLRVALSKVRTSLVAAELDARALRSSAGGYRLHLGEGVEVDVEVASHDLEEAERALFAGDSGTARKLAISARGVLSAPLLPGAEGPWVDDRRRWTRGLPVRALEAEAEATSAQGEGAAAVGAAENAVALEPFHESSHRALMRAHATAGNKAEALRSYWRCRQLLGEELGVDPAPATEALYLQLLRDEPFESSALAKPPPAPVTQPAGRAAALDAGRDALAGRRRDEAFSLLSRADSEGSLAPEALEALGEAALWSGHNRVSISARHRAHMGYLEAGDTRAAARVAVSLASNHGIRLELAVAEGWARTAARLLDDEPEAAEHGFLASVMSVVLLETGELNASLEQAQLAYDIGRRLGIPDLQALGITIRGLVLARQDHVHEALSLLNESMALAVSGRLSPLTTGMIYCRTIWTSLDLFDYRRAAEWIDTVQRCEVETGFGGNPGDCSAHLAAALVARGSWEEAEREAERACHDAETFELSHIGLASYTLGEIHFRRGNLQRAADAFRRAAEYGMTPQPGAALLELAKGDVAAAFASVKSFLKGASVRLARARVLPAAVEIALAAGDPEWARSAAEELAGIAEAYGSAALTAGAARARGAVSLSDGGTSEAVRGLSEAVEAYRQAQMPYEVARTRALLAQALLAEGDRVGAVSELEASRNVFDR
jgi:DNA-binding SARP family transcriptional activator